MKDSGQSAGNQNYKAQPYVPNGPQRRQPKSCRTLTQERIPGIPNSQKGGAKVKSQSKNWTPRAEKCPQISTETDATNSRRTKGLSDAQNLRQTTISHPDYVWNYMIPG